MKSSSISGVLCTLLVAGAAHAERPFDAFDETPRFMFYVQKHVGGPRHRSGAPSLGFSIERQTPTWSRTDLRLPAAPTVRLFDLRFAPFDGGAIHLNGLQLTGKTSHGLGYEGSYGEGDSWNSPWLWAGAGLAALLGISCATDNWPCEGSGYGGDSGYQPPGS